MVVPCSRITYAECPLDSGPKSRRNRLPRALRRRSATIAPCCDPYSPGLLFPAGSVAPCPRSSAVQFVAPEPVAFPLVDFAVVAVVAVAAAVAAAAVVVAVAVAAAVVVAAAAAVVGGDTVGCSVSEDRHHLGSVANLKLKEPVVGFESCGNVSSIREEPVRLMSTIADLR